MSYGGEERRDPEQPATAGAQRQIDAIRHDLRLTLRAMITAMVILTAAVTFVITRIENEREARAGSVADLIDLFCTQNNDQDTLLGTLVAISLEGAPPRERLNAQERDGLRVFREALFELRDPTECARLVLRFQEGEPIGPELGK